MCATIGEKFVTALAAKDADGLRAVLDPGLDFRALTPGKFWECDGADDERRASLHSRARLGREPGTLPGSGEIRLRAADCRERVAS